MRRAVETTAMLRAMNIDTAAVDLALTTTRAVRRRLDLERPVDDQIILDCIDIAEQAPTGGNQSSRRWIVVRDPELKAELARLYRDAAGDFMIAARDRLEGTDHPSAPAMRSAAYLAEHLAEVPVIVIPTIVGRHDGSGSPGLFDSVIQSAWSFCVALRARGLGSAWTTAVLAKAPELKELLGIPAEITEIAMLPVAWTKGTDFHPVARTPARQITFFDGYGRTYESGPGTPVSMADGPGVVVESDIAAPIERVWAAATDINLPANFSDEFISAAWDDGHDGPSLGAAFRGRNQHELMGEWEARCYVDVCDEPNAFGWCTSDPTNPGARWRFEMQALVGGSTRLLFRLLLGPGPSGLTGFIEQAPDKEHRFIANRLRAHRANMTRVVDGIKAHVEASNSTD